MTKKKIVPWWRVTLREWSTWLWTLAVIIGTTNQIDPNMITGLLRELHLGLSEETITRVSVGLGVVGLIAKFAPQAVLTRVKQERYAEQINEMAHQGRRADDADVDTEQRR